MDVEICEAVTGDVEVVAAILKEAAEWLEHRGMAMWRANELSSELISQDVASGLFHLASVGNQPVGTIKFQLSDVVFWPDVLSDDSAFVHRLAVSRKFAGTGISTALLKWAVIRTATLRRRFLRLDCEASRPQLRGVYERFGFRHHSDRQVGPYFVARYEIDVRMFDAGTTDMAV